MVDRQVPTGILFGLLKDGNSKLIHPVALMKLSNKASVTLRDGERRTNVSCKMSLSSSVLHCKLPFPLPLRLYKCDLHLSLEMVHNGVQTVRTMLRMGLTWSVISHALE